MDKFARMRWRGIFRQIASILNQGGCPSTLIPFEFCIVGRFVVLKQSKEAEVSSLVSISYVFMYLRITESQSYRRCKHDAQTHL